MDLKEFEAIIHGKVQMVMFRDFTQTTARKLGITGHVANRPDGTVRVVAQGPETRLNQLLHALHEGPTLANVSKVDVTWRKPSEIYDDFRITY